MNYELDALFEQPSGQLRSVLKLSEKLSNNPNVHTYRICVKIIEVDKLIELFTFMSYLPTI